MHNPNDKKKSVLFLCTGNSARSQMAEALLRHKAGKLFDVFSAGTQSETVDQRTIVALENFGLPVSSLKSKNINVFERNVFDYVITLCDKANQECQAYSGAKKQMAWDFPDPKTRPGNNPFATTLNELNNRLSMFIMLEAKEKNVVDKNNEHTSKKIKEQPIEIDPIIFYKCLTDEIRLKTLMLTNYHGELCVCELMETLQENSQPKVSRNLALLKKAKIITDRKHGQWVFYRINTHVPAWVKNVISQTTENNIALIRTNIERLSKMRNRPDKTSFC